MKAKRRLFKLLMLSLTLTFAILIGMLISFSFVTDQFRQATRLDQANLIGQVMSSHPNLQATDLVNALQTAPNQANLDAGESVLRQSGLLASDYDSTTTRQFTKHIRILIILGLVVLAGSLIGLLIWRELHEQHRIHDLVNYLQTLKEQVYDLRLSENSEDELSLLTNEIYKLIVLLQESVAINRKQRHDLEDALADISHQLRTPLTSIQVMVDNVTDDPQMPVEVRQDFLQSISQQITAMSALVTTLLNLAKFDNGTIKLHRQKVLVKDLLHQVFQRLEILADLQDVQLDLSGDLGAQLQIDPRWQIEALTNIIKNCIEHSSSGSAIYVKVTDGPLFVRLVVTDEGEGISPHELKHIFERFYKASNAQAESIGIGLAFAKTAIQAENGQISARSQLGTGTQFIITYPK